MKTNLNRYAILALMLFASNIAHSQTVDVQYLSPKIINAGNYKFIRFGTASSYQAGFMYNETNANYGDGDDFSIFTYGNRDLTLRPGNGNLIVFPSAGGNMGVGTTSPSSKFHVKTGNSNGLPHGYSKVTVEHSENAMISILTPSDKVSYFGFADTDDAFVGGIQYSHSTNDMAFRVNNYSNGSLVIKSNENVGIGTNSPSEKLHVAGNAALIGDIIMDYGKSLMVDTDWSGNGEAKILKTGWESGRDDYLDFYVPGNNSVNQTARLSILQSGSVGIGTTTPTEKLEVNGTIRSREVKVETTGWPDYVFEPNYKLRSLEEIEKFIKSNNHLPEVPSSAEVEENGIALGEMNALLLKKIEELTLHIIEQEKRIKKLEDEK